MVKNITLTEAEEKTCGSDLADAPLTSPDLVALAEREMDWEKVNDLHGAEETLQ